MEKKTLYYRKTEFNLFFSFEEIHFSEVFPCYCGRFPHIFSLNNNKLWSVYCPFCKNEKEWTEEESVAFENWNNFRIKQIDNLKKIL